MRNSVEETLMYWILWTNNTTQENNLVFSKKLISSIDFASLPTICIGGQMQNFSEKDVVLHPCVFDGALTCLL